jgi:hypothetical protein
MSFATWSGLFGAGGSLEDSDGDRLVNRFEYRFGLIPTLPDSPAWTMELERDAGGNPVAALVTVRQALAADEAHLAFRISTDLQQWAPAPATRVRFDPLDHWSATTVWRIPLTAGAPRIFLQPGAE